MLKVVLAGTWISLLWYLSLWGPPGAVCFGMMLAGGNNRKAQRVSKAKQNCVHGNVLSQITASMKLPNRFPTFSAYDHLLGSSAPNKRSMSSCMHFCQDG
jgi:hypothetical protein